MNLIAIGSDHAGYALKETIKRSLLEQGYSVEDKGCDGPDSVDYPDYAEAVARRVAGSDGVTGVLICGTGIGMCMSANKIRGIRAALVHGEFEARMSKEHNDANILCLGARTLASDVALNLVRTFLAAEFQGDRHARRVGKMMALES